MNPERKVEIMLWDWLKCKGNSVKNVYFNSINEVGAEVFRVIGTIKTKPDLVIEFENPYTHNIEYMAIEVKDASKSGNVRGGTKVFEEYLLNVIEGKTKYFIGDKEIEIKHFAIATQFSPEGHLRKREGLEFNESIRGKIGIGGVIVPWFEFSGTKEIHREMVTSFAKYRKDKKNLIYKKASIGILISDVLLNFSKDELKKQSGMKGKPIYQAITFNSWKKRWSQCLMKI